MAGAVSSEVIRYPLFVEPLSFLVVTCYKSQIAKIVQIRGDVLVGRAQGLLGCVQGLLLELNGLMRG